MAGAIIPLSFQKRSNRRCRSRKIFGGAKDFRPNLPKLPRKVFVQLCLQIFSRKRPFFGVTSKKGLHVFFCKPWAPFFEVKQH